MIGSDEIHNSRSADARAIARVVEIVRSDSVTRCEPIDTEANKSLALAKRGIAVELGEYGIRVNCLCPGPIDTPMLRGWFQSGDPAEPVDMDSKLVGCQARPT